MTWRLVVPGEASGVVAAYGRAVMLAGRVRELLGAAGLDSHEVLVVPSLTEAGEPVVCLMPRTGPAGRLLAQIVGGEAGPTVGGQRCPPVPDRGGGWPVA